MREEISIAITFNLEYSNAFDLNGFANLTAGQQKFEVLVLQISLPIVELPDRIATDVCVAILNLLNDIQRFLYLSINPY